MENDQLKKFLAGLCIASLLAGASLTAGCSTKNGSG
jgi:radical SAM modification target selenobiotic family peptide